MKNPILIIVVAVVLWLVLKPKTAAAADSEKSTGLFGLSGVVDGLSLISYEGATPVSESTATTSDTTTVRPTLVKPGTTIALFTFPKKTKSPFQWRNSEK